MATIANLSSTLLRRLKDVPKVTIEDTTDWITLAMAEHGYEPTDDVPSEYVYLILLFAEADAAGTVALRTAHYFSWKDNEESVDMRAVSEQYRKIATELWKKYNTKKSNSGLQANSRFSIMKRVDR